MNDELYKTLGVLKNATQDEIKQAYRTLSKKHHPDAGGDVEEFKRIAGAYQIIGDPEHRQEYDRNGTTRVKDVRREKKAAILEAVIDQGSKEYVLDPLQKLVVGERKIKMNKDKIKQRLGEVISDIKKLRKSKKFEEISTVLGMLESMKSSLEALFDQSKIDHEVTQELIAEFKKACTILNRTPREVSHHVRMAWERDSTASTT